jgi:aspartate racemase
MAQQLRAQRKEVAMVALLDSSVVLRRKRKATHRLSFLGDLLRDLPSWLIGSFQLNGSQWLNLVKLKIRMGKARRAASRSSAIGIHQTYVAKLIEEMGDLFHFSEQHRKVARAQYRALRKYTAQVYPDRLTLFRARMQPLFSSHNPDKGWGAIAAGGVEIKVVPGNHLSMLQEPHVQVLAEKLRACLDGYNQGQVTAKQPHTR